MKQIATLFSAILPSNNTSFMNRFLNCSIMQNNSQITMSDILFLIECFEGYGPECNGIYLSGIEYVQQFFRCISQKQLQGLVSIKLSLTIHLILYEFQVGECLADELVKNCNLIKITDKSCHCSIIQSYLVYLMKLAQSLKVFYASKVGQYPPMEPDEVDPKQGKQSVLEDQQQIFRKLRKQGKFSENNAFFQQYQQQQIEKQYQAQQHGSITLHQKTLILYKLHNLLCQCIEILKNCVQAVSMYNDDTQSLYIEICCVLWNDSMVMYKFSTAEVNCCQQLINIRSLPFEIILSLQQLYQSTVSITVKLQSIFRSKSAFDTQKMIRCPFWFEENKKLTKDLETAIINSRVVNRADSRSHRFPNNTPQAALRPVSPRNFQIFSARNPQGSKPFFTSHHKGVSDVMHSPPDSRRHQYVKQIIGSIFEDKVPLSPRDKRIETSQGTAKESTQSTRIQQKQQLF